VPIDVAVFTELLEQSALAINGKSCILDRYLPCKRLVAKIATEVPGSVSVEIKLRYFPYPPLHGRKPIIIVVTCKQSTVFRSIFV
jgi:hypothetical protein